MALIDAGISVSGFITSATVAIGIKNTSDPSTMDVDKKENYQTLILDPTAEQSLRANSLLTIAWDHRGRQVLNSYHLAFQPDFSTEPNQQEELFWSATDLAKKSAAKILNFQRQTIKQKVLYEASAGLPAAETKAN